MGWWNLPLHYSQTAGKSYNKKDKTPSGRNRIPPKVKPLFYRLLIKSILLIIKILCDEFNCRGRKVNSNIFRTPVRSIKQLIIIQ